PWLLVVGICAACSGNQSNGGGGGNQTPDGGSSSDDASVPPGTEVLHLVSSDYTVPAGQEVYPWERITVPNDIYLVKITPLSPLGVHHEVVAIDPSGTPDGRTTCGPTGLGWTNLFASGVNSPSLSMPDGVALKVSAGQQVVLNLHLFN